eukprot:2432533-Prymnesium_polylepis.1
MPHVGVVSCGVSGETSATGASERRGDGEIGERTSWWLVGGCEWIERAIRGPIAVLGAFAPGPGRDALRAGVDPSARPNRHRTHRGYSCTT